MGAQVDVDDFEIEVTSLWRGRDDDAAAWRETASSSDTGPSRSPLALRLSGRGRMLRAGGACAAVALALLLLLSGDPRMARARRHPADTAASDAAAARGVRRQRHPLRACGAVGHAAR